MTNKTVVEKVTFISFLSSMMVNFEREERKVQLVMTTQLFQLSSLRPQAHVVIMWGILELSSELPADDIDCKTKCSPVLYLEYVFAQSARSFVFVQRMISMCAPGKSASSRASTALTSHSTQICLFMGMDGWRSF